MPFPHLFLFTFMGLMPSQEVAFQFKEGQVITYQVDQQSVATDAMGENASTVKNRTRVTKEWRVAQVGPEKVATVEMRLRRLIIETTRPNGEVLRFDSEMPEGPLKESLAPLVGPVVAKLKIDIAGRVLEVLESRFGSPSRFDAEPPFIIIANGRQPMTGLAWNRAYTAVLSPPAGAGEKIDLVQKYEIKALDKGLATLEIKTVPARPFASPADEIPLIQIMPGGMVVFDLARGLVKSAELEIDRKIMDASGPGSLYRFQGTFRETLLD